MLNFKKHKNVTKITSQLFVDEMTNFHEIQQTKHFSLNKCSLFYKMSKKGVIKLKWAGLELKL